MENKIEVFAHDEFGSVRTVIVDGEPWFVGKDVAAALAYGNGNTKSKALSNAIKDHVDDEDKGVTEMVTPGGRQKITIINESGLYSLILSSKLPKAKQFKRWITSEVIPSIRKHGMYMTDTLCSAVEEQPEIITQIIENMKADKVRAAQLEDELKIALPKAEYYDKFVDPGYATNFRDTAKELEIPPKRFINLLLEYKFIFRTTKNELRPASRALAKGLFILRDYTGIHSRHRGTYTLVTAKGKKCIYEYFKKKGIFDKEDVEL